ncbi:MAG: leucyl aminopeptidase [Bacteroidales bacterium]|nr:leucyl aminopeptidase [Bacteroidales bacterium]
MIAKLEKKSENKSKVYIIDNVKNLEKTRLSKDEINYVKQQYKDHKIAYFEFNRFVYTDFVAVLDTSKSDVANFEQARIAGKNMQTRLSKLNFFTIQLIDECLNPILCMTFAEGLRLSNYQFTKHKTKPKNQYLDIQIVSKKLSKTKIDTLNLYCEAVYFCKDLINEPHNFQSAVQFSKTLANKAKTLGVKAIIFDKKHIESLKMGGLLGVNKGSTNPPTFTILEWKPQSIKNSKPIVLVGKGLVFDTGGMNLKTDNFMNDMKYDMAGGATVAATIFGLAATKSKHHVIALIPSTDNRPGAHALVPGDVITMRSGKTVEVVNTDAEGRLILADALDYAKLYKPQLVIDAATLTGSASRAIGKHGIVAMQTNAEKFLQILQKSGEEVCERIVEFPLWEEYTEELKSEVADIKNCGSAYAGAITAGKFLTEFTDYPFIHLDIAGVAFNTTAYKYFGSQASGFGVRLLINFFEKM